MKLNLKKELAALERLTVGELQQRYVEVFGEPVRSRHKQYLIRRIAWRLQANAEGGLTGRFAGLPFGECLGIGVVECRSLVDRRNGRAVLGRRVLAKARADRREASLVEPIVPGQIGFELHTAAGRLARIALLRRYPGAPAASRVQFSISACKGPLVAKTGDGLTRHSPPLQSVTRPPASSTIKRPARGPVADGRHGTVASHFRADLSRGAPSRSRSKPRPLLGGRIGQFGPDYVASVLNELAGPARLIVSPRCIGRS